MLCSTLRHFYFACLSRRSHRSQYPVLKVRPRLAARPVGPAGRSAGMKYTRPRGGPQGGGGVSTGRTHLRPGELATPTSTGSPLNVNLVAYPQLEGLRPANPPVQVKYVCLIRKTVSRDPNTLNRRHADRQIEQDYPEEISAPTSYHTKFKTPAARPEANDLRFPAKPPRKEAMRPIEVNYTDAKGPTLWVAPLFEASSQTAEG